MFADIKRELIKYIWSSQRVFKWIAHEIFHGIRDTFRKTEWNIRDFGKQGILDSRGTRYFLDNRESTHSTYSTSQANASIITHLKSCVSPALADSTNQEIISYVLISVCLREIEHYYSWAAALEWRTAKLEHSVQPPHIAWIISCGVR